MLRFAVDHFLPLDPEKALAVFRSKIFCLFIFLQNLDQAFFLPLNAAGIMEHRQQFSQTMGALEDLTRKTFLEFQAQIDPVWKSCRSSH